MAGKSNGKKYTRHDIPLSLMLANTIPNLGKSTKHKQNMPSAIYFAILVLI